MAVFVTKLRSLKDKISLFTDIDKYQQTLRAICIDYGMPRLVAAITNFRYWHFIQFDLQHEISVVAGQQIKEQLSALRQNTAAELPSFGNLSLQAFQEADRDKPIDIFDGLGLCDFSLLKLFKVLERIIREGY